MPYCTWGVSGFVSSKSTTDRCVSAMTTTGSTWSPSNNGRAFGRESTCIHADATGICAGLLAEASLGI